MLDVGHVVDEVASTRKNVVLPESPFVYATSLPLESLSSRTDDVSDVLIPDQSTL